MLSDVAFLACFTLALIPVSSANYYTLEKEPLGRICHQALKIQQKTDERNLQPICVVIYQYAIMKG